ncbi:MAG: 2-C-methyl-D-erythritol 2,4-cyclodiphosphate synthase, partial [Alphaproteobacteria bacterium]
HEATDDAAVAEAAGLAVRLVAGEPDNIKITVADDLIRVRQSLAAGGDSRIGQGLDVHRFGPAVEGGTRIWLCGVALPHDRPLIGHSDADAGLHALTDAVLGAIGAGDIGQHFPPTDGRWRGASSDQFLAYAAGLVRQGGGTIINLDVTLVCESPRIAPHRVVMADRIAAIAGVAASRVSVKATTTEGLGFAGRGEGVLAQAVAMIRWPI